MLVDSERHSSNTKFGRQIGTEETHARHLGHTIGRIVANIERAAQDDSSNGTTHSSGTAEAAHRAGHWTGARSRQQLIVSRGTPIGNVHATNTT
ncbi:hypothetical protein ACFOYW_00185 [Gryllotalpicola reticulitermitis]|uniref:Uncharacterized protein n=1 Tax=Gryllotalpicola reticulitermitis TaxID=1184153 RepID=A0ABV8Q1X0_9MICO